MLLLDLPITTRELAALNVFTLPHQFFGLHTGLEPGQLVIGQDEDGAFWGLQVELVRFYPYSTSYRFVVGDPVSPDAVAILVGHHSRLPLTRGEVALRLRSLTLARVAAASA